MKTLLFFVFLLSAFYARSQSNVFDVARTNDTISMSKLLTINPDTVNSVNDRGHTPLILATYNGNLPMVRYLVKKGADVNLQMDQGTALHGVAYKGELDIAIHLLENGAKVNLQNINGTTPLIYAVLFKHGELAKKLFEYGSDPTIKDKTGQSANDYATSVKDQQLIKLFKSNPK